MPAAAKAALLPHRHAPPAPQVKDVCCAANRRLVVKRARFSALIARDLHAAMQQLGTPNQASTPGAGSGPTRRQSWRWRGAERDRLGRSRTPC